jgi:hypothetical protein
MNRLLCISAFLLTLLAPIAWAQCTNIVTVNSAIDAESTAGAVFITLDGQCEQAIPTVEAGTPITIVSKGAQFGLEAKNVVKTTLLTRIEGVAAGPAAEHFATLDQLATDDPTTVTIGGASFAGTIVNAGSDLLRITRYAWSVGPATKSTPDGTAAATPDPDAQGAFRLTYDGEYARPGFLGRGKAEAKFETRATLSIDTTSSDDTGYIDNNRASVGIRSVELPLSDLLAQAQFGIEGRVSRALHHDAQDSDLVATFSGWIPSLPSKTIFSSGPGYISPPLAIALSYGYRRKIVPGADTISGRSGEATATYYLYAFDNYQLTLSGTWTLNDMSNRPAAVPRTQRMYKVGIAYLTNPAKGFEVQTSYEAGSIGPLLTKVRQYSIGIATKKFSFAGGSKN